MPLLRPALTSKIHNVYSFSVHQLYIKHWNINSKILHTILILDGLEIKIQYADVYSTVHRKTKC